MRRFLLILLLLLLFVSPVSADPLSLSEDLEDTVTVFYNGEDDSGGCYVYSFCYPCVSDSNDLSAVCINEYYSRKVEEYKDFYIPSQATEYGRYCQNVDIKVSYLLTCNNDDFFSVLISKTENVEGDITVVWEGNTFSRSSEVIGSLTSLPKLLGLVDDGESDEWYEDRQSMKVFEVICSLVWEEIRSNPDSLPYVPDLEKEDLEYIIDPVLSLDQDFYLDENGNVVFFILPGRIAPEDAGLMTFIFSPEQIRDEL